VFLSLFVVAIEIAIVGWGIFAFLLAGFLRWLRSAQKGF